MGPKIIITPFGGHGTVTLYKYLSRLKPWIRIVPRPDYPFSKELKPYDLDKKPRRNAWMLHQGLRVDRVLQLESDWRFRTGLSLNYDATIRSNLHAAFHAAKGKVILFGKCSLTESFLTNEEINANCMVRHPLYALDSFMGSRHPQWVWHEDGINAPEFIEWYFKQWWKVVDDFAESGNPILKYEQWPKDMRRCGWNEFADIVEPIWKPTSQCRFISEKGARLMYDIFYDSDFHYLYEPDTWKNYVK